MIQKIYLRSVGKNEEYSRSTITGGEVLVSVIGRIGLVDVVPKLEEEMNITRNVARITPKKTDPIWLSYYLKSKPVQDMLSVISSTTTRSSLNIGDLRKLEVFVPPLDEQREIAERLSVVDEKIRQEEEYREKLEELKKGLMQDLLTGKKRVEA
ncbi:type I restriction-modification system, S subunit [Candidatus Haloredivivus sp. G17]|nr:type I restriction-modification system, S subunit [Candidatus Haloredivivus sp. G17]